jgi:hypothetical protein
MRKSRKENITLLKKFLEGAYYPRGVRQGRIERDDEGGR